MSDYSGLAVSDHALKRYVERVLRATPSRLLMHGASQTMHRDLSDCERCHPLHRGQRPDDYALMLRTCVAYVRGRDGVIATVVTLGQYEHMRGLVKRGKCRKRKDKHRHNRKTRRRRES